MTPPSLVAAATVTGTDIALLVLVVALILVTGVLAASETAITRTSRVRAVSLEEEERRGAKTLVAVAEHTERVLPVVLFALEISTLVAATLVGVVASHVFGGLGVVVATAFEIVVIFVVAELAPKTWAVQHTDRAALLLAPIARLLYRLAPLRWVTQGLIKISNFLIPGKGVPTGPYVSEELLRAMADTAADEEVIEKAERTLIHSIIDFGDTVVRDVMVPRPDMVVVESTGRISDVVDIAINVGYSRIPVTGQNIDDVVGIVFVKDLMRAVREGAADDGVTTIMRDAQFVPESKRVAELLPEMQASNQHMAIVVDEFGGTAGLVTLEDLIEELVGEIRDEYDIEQQDAETLDDGSLVVNARMPIDEVNELLPDDDELPEGDWDTVGGLVYSQLGHVPTEGEEVTYEGHHLVALEVSGRRIGRVRISTLPSEEVAGDEPDRSRDHDVTPSEP